MKCAPDSTWDYLMLLTNVAGWSTIYDTWQDNGKQNLTENNVLIRTFDYIRKKKSKKKGSNSRKKF